MLKSISFISIIILITTSFSFQVEAVDTVKILKPLLGKDKRSKHKDEVILRALQVTQNEFGPYEFQTIDGDMSPGRALISMQEGTIINTFIAPSNDDWNTHTTVIKIPVRQGLLSYRLLLVNKNSLDKFKQVENLTDLKKLTAGLHSDWVTTDVFKQGGMKVLTAHNYEGLFLMLSHNRFDYMPRAIYEVYDELNNRETKLKDVVVEPSIALYLPMVSYVYISPKEPRLAKRIETGLRKLVASGEIKDILNKYYADDIKQANLENRKIIKIENPDFKDDDIINDKDLWIQY